MATTTINKESFMALSKDEMWDLLQTNRMADVNNKLDTIIGKFTKLESELSVAKSANAALKKEIINLKRKVNRDSMYSRQENLELSGIPESVSNESLEATTLALLRKTGVDCTPRDIVDCHRLRNKKDVIVRFVNRKHALQALSGSKYLKGNTNDIIPNAKIYVNRNLTPEYKSLRWQAKKLKSENYIEDFGTNRRGVWIKAEAGGPRKQIDVAEDLIEYLPDGIFLSDICN